MVPVPEASLSVWELNQEFIRLKAYRASAKKKCLTIQAVAVHHRLDWRWAPVQGDCLSSHWPYLPFPPTTSALLLFPSRKIRAILIKVGVKRKEKKGKRGEVNAPFGMEMLSVCFFFPPNPFISHKVSMVVYSNPYKRPLSPSHALKALRMHFLTGYATQSINTACHEAYG